MDLSNPTTVAMIGGIVRTALVLAGGGALMSGDQLGQAAGIIAAIVCLAWSLWQKHSSAQDKHATVVAAVTEAAANPQNASAIIAAAKAGHF